MTSNTTSRRHYEVCELHTRRYQGHEPHFHEVVFKSAHCKQPVRMKGQQSSFDDEFIY